MPPLPPSAAQRMDEAPDALFYREPRLVLHIDRATVDALTSYYGEVLTPGADVLDLMSSWISHLPAKPALGRVAGLGMNRVELDANPALGEAVVQDLNSDPRLPWDDESFDLVLNAVSVQYLARPFEVFDEVARVLRPGGRSIVAMSHRCFPTKAIRAFHVAGADPRYRIVRDYHEACEAFESVETLDRSPANADPLWIVTARKRASPPSDR